MLYSVPLPGTASASETPAHRFPTARAGLTACAPPDITTVYGAFQYRLARDPERLTMGRRPVLQAGDAATPTKPRLGAYEWLTYREINEITRELGAGLAKMVRQGKEPGRVVIYAPTSREWTLCMLACYAQGLQVVTAYDTLGADGVLHAMNETGAQIVFAHASQLPLLLRVAPRMASVHSVVYYADACGASPEARDAASRLARTHAVATVDDARRVGRAWPRDAHVAHGSDVALVMYTSGSTGAPRGAVVAHGGLLAVCGAIEQLVPAAVDRDADRVLSYLPLAHVLAFFVETYCLYAGLAIGYGTPRTLADTGEASGLGDLRALRPAVMLGVPLVWAGLRSAILRQVAQRPRVVQWVFHAAVEAKAWLAARGLPAGLLDRVVFRKTRAATGGRLKFAITGGAQISGALHKFVSAAVCPLLQGYGLTEASGLVAVQLPGDATRGNVGAPMPCVEIKLIDAPGSNYFARDGCGEICLRGPTVFRGYLGEENCLEGDGWLRTGDVGRWVEGGRLAVVDRLRNLVKLANGEFVALEALEAAYAAAARVALVCVVADARMRRPCAIVSLDQDCPADPVDPDRVLALLLDAARAAGLPPQHMLAAVCIDPEPWTPENGMLTAASKLRRAAISQRNESRLMNVFKEMERRGERLCDKD